MRALTPKEKSQWDDVVSKARSTPYQGGGRSGRDKELVVAPGCSIPHGLMRELPPDHPYRREFERAQRAGSRRRRR